MNFINHHLSAIPIHGRKEIFGSIIFNDQEIKATLLIAGLETNISFVVPNKMNIDLTENTIIKFKDDQGNTYFLRSTDRHQSKFEMSYTGMFCKGIFYVSEILQSQEHYQEFLGIAVVLSGISQWLDENRFDISFKLAEKVYIIRAINIEFSKSDVAFEIKLLEGKATAEELKQIIFKLKILFTLLIGSSVSIDFLWLINGDLLPAFLLISNNDKVEPFRPDSLDHINNATITYYDLKSQFSNIFQTYFADAQNIFSEIGIRLASLFSYTSYWDLEFSYLLCIMEGYASLITKNKTKKSLRKEKQILCSFIKDQGFEQETKNTFIKGINAIRIDDTFSEKIRLLLKTLSGHLSVFKILKLFENDLDLFLVRLKKYRNNYTHSNFSELPKDKNELSDAIKFLKKLRQLLLLLLYKDMGIDIRKLLILFNNRLFLKNIMNECIDDNFDTIELAREAGDIFISIDEKTYRIVKSKPLYVDCVFIKDKNGIYHFNESYTNIAQNYFSDQKRKDYHSIMDYLSSKINKAVIYGNYCFLEFTKNCVLRKICLFVSSD